MGVVLDSSVLIGAERAGQNPRAVIEDLAVKLGDTEATLSIITLVELAHGIERADSAARQTGRERFIEELLKEIPVEPITGRVLRCVAGRSPTWRKYYAIRIRDLEYDGSTRVLGPPHA